MDSKHKIALELNEKILALIQDLNKHPGDDFVEVDSYLKKVSKCLLEISLKTFNNENNRISKT